MNKRKFRRELRQKKENKFFLDDSDLVYTTGSSSGIGSGNGSGADDPPPEDDD